MSTCPDTTGPSATRAYSGWYPMALIDAERDDAALLAAEDQAIAEAANPKTPEPVDDATVERVRAEKQAAFERLRGMLGRGLAVLEEEATR